MQKAPVLATLIVVVGEEEYVRTIPAPANADGSFDVEVDVENRVRSTMRQLYKRGLVEGNWKQDGFLSSIPGDAIDRIEAFRGELEATVDVIEVEATDADVQDA